MTLITIKIMEIFIWIIAAYGMSNILVFGSIFEGLRDFLIKKSTFLGDLIQCMMCTSTWVGFFFSVAFFSPTLELVVIPYTNWFFDGIFVGKQDASSNSLTIKLEGVVQRQGGAASILGAVFKFVVHDDSGDVWDVNATVSGNNLVINVSGQAGTTIDWTGHLRTTEVQD